MSTDLAIRADQSGFDDAQIAALRALGVENAPVGDLDLFFHQSRRLGLDPFAKQIYLIGRRTKVTEWDGDRKAEKWVVKYTIQTGIDGFRVIRSRPHDHAYLGQKEEWCGPDGVWRDVWLADEPPAAAKVSLFIEGYLEPIVGIARYVEYVQTYGQGGDPNAMWKKMPAGQLAKCAEALATRKAYPNDLSGVFTDDEMGQADNIGPTTLVASKPSTTRANPQTGEVREQPVERAPYDQEEADQWAAQISGVPEEGNPQAKQEIEADTLAGVYLRAQKAGALEHYVDDPARIRNPKTVWGLIEERRTELQDALKRRQASA